MDNSEIGNGYKSPMTLGEIARSEESELTSEISTIEIKMACIGFSRDINNQIENPDYVLEYAKKLFEWITGIIDD